MCCDCCLLSGRGLCDELIIRPEDSYRLWCVAVCDLETSWMRRPWPNGGEGGWLRQKKGRKNVQKWSRVNRSVKDAMTSHKKSKKINLKCFNRNVWRPQLRMFMRYIYIYLTYAIRKTACKYINPLNPELNPICYLLALLAHHFLHVSRIRVKSLTLRLLMPYLYGAPILDVSRSHTTTHHSR